MKWLEKIWYKEKKFKWYQKPLIIFSYLYQLIIIIRSQLYKLNLIKVTHFSVPVIVVGNITTGGTGKTPLVAALAKAFKKMGFTPGIVSRGYKATSKTWPQVLNKVSDVYGVGDEPLLLFKKTQCPVVVDPNRVRAIKTLLAQSSCDIVLSDDGLQHLRLGRDIEIAVLDGQRGIGNGYCLPAGPLREGVNRLKQVDFVLIRGEKKLPTQFPLEIVALDLISIQNSNKKQSFENFTGHIVHAVAAIGNPDQFFKMLESKRLDFMAHTFRDHHQYVASDFSFLKPNEYVIMTEKDALKCKAFADHRFYYLAIDAIFPQEFLTALFERIKTLS